MEDEMLDRFWFFMAKCRVRGLRKAEVKQFLIYKDDVVKNFVFDVLSL